MADTSLKDLTSAVYKIAENSPKIQKDVKDIRDAICGTEGIRESIVYLSRQLEHMQKRNTLNKLTGKNAANNSKHLVKNTNSISSTLTKILDQIKRMSGRGSRLNKTYVNPADNRRKLKEFKNLSGALDIIERLRNVRLKDFIFAKSKIKNIRKIMSNFLSTFRMFKNQKEVNGTLNFANSSIDLMKKLSKISILSKTAQIGAKAIQKIFLGGKKDIHGGLLGLFRKISKHERHIRRGKRAMKEILASCGSMLLTTIILTGIAVAAVPAMLGALLMKGVVWLLVGTYKFLSKSGKAVLKGSAVMLLMSASIVTFALGLGAMALATKNMSWKQFGLMMASIGALGATMAILGIPVVAGLVALGSATLLVMGLSLGIFALSIMAWQKIDVKKSIGNIKIAVQGLRETFGLELGKPNEKKSFGQRLVGGVMDIAMGVLNFGSSFFIMGQLLLAGAALGLLYKGLKNWDNFNGLKAATNIKIAIGALKETFGLEDKKNKKEKFGSKLKKFGGKILDIATTLLQGSESLAKMGIITLATGMADVIRLTLIPWRKFDAKPAAKNLKEAFASLKDAFGLNDKNENLGQKTIRLFGSALDMASTLLSSGGVLVKMGTIMLATGLADVIKLNLKPWETYDGSNAVTHLSGTINSLKSLFGLEDKKNENLGLKIINTTGSIFDLASALLQGGSIFAKMGTITLATGLAGKIKEYIMPWENYNGKNAIGNIEIAINGLMKLFELDSEDTEEKKGFFKKLGEAFKNIGNAASSAIEAIANIAEGGSYLSKIAVVATATKLLAVIQNDISPWGNFNASNAITNMSKTLDGLSKISSIKFDTNFNVPLKSAIDNINALDITKASTVVEIFKSFADIKNKPLDAFTKAVDKFSESCTDLIESLNKFDGTNNTTDYTIPTTNKNTGNVGVDINNKEEFAMAIANAIKSLPINVRTDISDVKLVINNETGRRVILTLDN